MAKATNREELAARAGRIRGALIAVLCAVILFAIVAVLLHDPVSGVFDVHVAGDGPNLLMAHQAALAPGEPYVVDRGIGRVGQILSSVIQTSVLGAAGFIIWALVKRRKRAAYVAIGWIVLISYAGPIPTIMQPDPPVAVSVPAARAALGVTGPANPGWLRETLPWRRYMLAEIAYAEGDRADAARLSAGLTSFDIASPIEGAYRLQFLQGHAPTVSSACFKFGCLTPAGQYWGERAALGLCLLAICLAVAIWRVLRVVRRRLAAIDELTATGRRVRAMA